MVWFRFYSRRARFHGGCGVKKSLPLLGLAAGFAVLAPDWTVRADPMVGTASGLPVPRFVSPFPEASTADSAAPPSRLGDRDVSCWG